MTLIMGFLSGSDGKESACNAGDLGLIPGSGRSPGEGNSYICHAVHNIPDTYLSHCWRFIPMTQNTLSILAHSLMIWYFCARPMDHVYHQICLLLRLVSVLSFVFFVLVSVFKHWIGKRKVAGDYHVWSLNELSVFLENMRRQMYKFLSIRF